MTGSPLTERSIFIDDMQKISVHTRLLQLVAIRIIFLTSGSLSQEEVQDEVVVTARYPDTHTTDAVFNSTTVTREQMDAQPETRLDDLLRVAALGFSLFRRSSSDVANPTTQGPSLRNIGPNGAGRTLVLLDGIPQNDPFGGWVNWHRLPPDLLEELTVVRGGGAGLFGNNALGGTIYLTRRRPGAFSGSLQVGSEDQYDGTLASALSAGPFQITAMASGYSTGGYPVVRDDQRGPVDIDADSEALVFDLGGTLTLNSGAQITSHVSWFKEGRGNGTPLTGNSTEAADLSLGYRSAPGEFQWETAVYYQQRQFESQFSSVSEDRRKETPALDQYDVPADSIGFSLTGTMEGGLPLERGREGSKLVAGLDARWVDGETRELFRYDGTRFLNRRVAGGEQFLAGVFAEQTWQATPALLLVLGGRADYWQVANGSRVERAIAGGELLLNNEFEDRDGVVGSGRFGAALRITEAFSLKTAAYSGFRVPTLNELYRPFRVRNDITEANAELEPEKLLGIEGGVEWKPHGTVETSATVFYNRLLDAVTNVTVLAGPGTAADGTLIPTGGVYRQRQNVDAVSTVGVELAAGWKPVDWFKLDAGYLFSETEVDEPSVSTLDGNELAQSPAHVATAAVTLTPHDRWQILLQGRFSSSQYEDDLNSNVLDGYMLWDASVAWKLKEGLRVILAVENVFDKLVETGITADGIVSIGAPRMVSMRVKWDF